MPNDSSHGNKKTAAWASVLGVLIGGGSTYATAVAQNNTASDNTRQQIQGEMVRSDQEFLRTHRVAAYTQYLAASVDLDRALRKYVHVFARAGDRGQLAAIDKDLNDSMIAELNASYNARTHESYQVKILQTG